MNTFKSITTRSSVLFVGKIFDAFFMFIFNFLAAKYIGAEGYGVYVYISTFIMFLSIALKLGMDQGLTALIPRLKNSDLEKELITFSIIFLAGLSAIILIILGINATFVANVLLNNPSLKDTFIIFLPMTLLIAFVQMSEGIFRTIGGIKHFFISKNILMPIVLVTSFLFHVVILKDLTLKALLISNYIAWSFNVIYLFVVLGNKGVLTFPKWSNRSTYLLLLKLSLPLILVGLLEFLMGRTDAYVIGYNLTEVEVGIYSIVDKLAYIGNFFFLASGSMMAPVLARYHQDCDYNELKDVYLKINKWILIVNTAVFGGLILLGHDVLALFGPEFKVGDEVLYALAFAQLINAFFGPLSYLNAMIGLEKKEWQVGSFIIILNLVLDLLVVKTHGIAGIALVTILVYLLGNLIRMRIFKKNYKMSLLNLKGLKIIVAGILAYIPASFVKQHYFIDSFVLRFLGFGFLFIILYIIMVWFLVLSERERMDISLRIRTRSI